MFSSVFGTLVLSRVSPELARPVIKLIAKQVQLVAKD